MATIKLCNIYMELLENRGRYVIEPLATFASLPIWLGHSFKMLMLVEIRSHCSGQSLSDELSAAPLDGCRKPVALRIGEVRQGLRVFLIMPSQECR